MKIAHYTPGTVSSVRGLSLPFAASWENQAKAARAPPHGPPSPSAKSVGLGLEHTISFAVSQVSASEKKNDATTTHFCYWKKKHFFLGKEKKERERVVRAGTVGIPGRRRLEWTSKVGVGGALHRMMIGVSSAFCAACIRSRRHGRGTRAYVHMHAVHSDPVRVKS
jgi:hypothetical protein